MVDGVNSSKKSYFIWLSVFLVLFLGLMGLMIYGASSDPTFLTDTMSKFIFIFAIPYLIATFPMGWTVRRRIMKWYVHVPTEDIDLSETNVVVAFFRLVKVEILAAFNLALLIFYFVASIVIGVFFTPYFIISGIVLMAKKDI